MELCTTKLFIYVHSKVKPSMKNKCYNIIVKFALLDQVSSISENAIMFRAILFVLEDFDRKKKNLL